MAVLCSVGPNGLKKESILAENHADRKTGNAALEQDSSVSLAFEAPVTDPWESSGFEEGRPLTLLSVIADENVDPLQDHLEGEFHYLFDGLD